MLEVETPVGAGGGDGAVQPVVVAVTVTHAEVPTELRERTPIV
jgi:hypothetical protein